VAPAYLIAEQYYCEEQVELELVRGEVATPEMDEGKWIHEVVLAMKPAKLEELVTRIISGERYGCSLPLLAEVEGVPVAGVPDLLVFEGGKPVEVIELKTAEKIPSSPWINNKVQALIYGLLLDLMGFDCSSLKLSVCYVRRGWELLPLLGLALAPKGAWKELEEEYPNDLRVFTFSYNRSEAESMVRWALSYWRGEREPIPTRKPEKCARCAYRDACPYIVSRDLSLTDHF